MSTGPTKPAVAPNELAVLVLVLVAVLAGLWLDDSRVHLRGDGGSPSAVDLNRNHDASPGRRRLTDLLQSAGLTRAEASRAAVHAAEGRQRRPAGWEVLGSAFERAMAWFSHPGAPYLGYSRVRQVRSVPALDPDQLRQLASQQDSLPLDFSIPRRLDQRVLGRMLAACGIDSVWALAIPDSELATLADPAKLRARLDALTLLPPGTSARERERGFPIHTGLLQMGSLDRISQTLQRTFGQAPALADVVAREILVRRMQDSRLRPSTLEHARAFPTHGHWIFWKRSRLDDQGFDQVLALLWPERPATDSTRVTFVNRASAQEIRSRLHLRSLADAQALVERRQQVWFVGLLPDRGIARSHPEATLAHAPSIAPATFAEIESRLIVRPRGAARLFLMWAAFSAAWLALAWRLRAAGIATRGAVAAMALAAGLGLIAMNGYVDVTRARDYAVEFTWKHIVLSVLAVLVLVEVLERGRAAWKPGAGSRMWHNLHAAFFAILTSPLALAVLVVLLCLLARVSGHGAGDSRITASLGIASFLPMKFCSSFAAVFSTLFILRNRAQIEHPFRRGLLLVFTGAFVGATGFVMAFLVRDFGSFLVVLLGWIGAYAAFVGRRRWLLAFAGFVAVLLIGGYEIVRARPELLPNDFYRVRCDMRVAPWNAGHPRADQLAYALWGQAAGGWFGTQPGQEPTSFIPAGHTDMMISVLVQEQGWLGLLVLCLALTAIFRVFFAPVRAGDEHSPTDIALRVGLGLPLMAESLLMLGGNLGLLPLTGLTLPFASFGHTGMLVNVASVVLAAWLATPGRTSTPRGGQVARGLRPATPSRLMLAWLGGMGIALAAAAWTAAFPLHILEHQLYVWGTDGRKLSPPLVERWLARAARPGTIYDRTGRFPLSLATIPPDAPWRSVRDSASGLEKADAQVLKEARSDVFAWIRAHPESRRFYPLGEAGFAAVGSVDTDLPSPSPARGVRALVDGGGDSTARAKLYRDRWQPGRPAPAGFDVRFTVDARLQRALHSRLVAATRRPGQYAAAIVLDDSGAVLAAVSLPALDLNRGDVLRELSPERARHFATNFALQEDPAAFPRPWAPGSVFKLVTLSSWLEHPGAPGISRCLEHRNAEAIRWNGGAIRAGGVREPEREGPGHGTLDLASEAAQREAFAKSCNVYFATMSARLGAAPMLATAREDLGLRLPDVPDAAAFNRNLAEHGFGQGIATLTPAELAGVGLMIAGDGRPARLRWVDAIRRARTRANARPEPWKEVREPLAGDGAGRIPNGLPASVARSMQQAMRGVCAPGGSAGMSYRRSRLAGLGADVFGKTGTAEMDRIAVGPDGKPYDGDIAWFVGVARWPDGRCHTAVVAVHDAEGMGGSVAAPVVFDALADAHQLVTRAAPGSPATAAAGGVRR